MTEDLDSRKFFGTALLLRVLVLVLVLTGLKSFL